MKSQRLLLVTTVPETFNSILRDQPRFLSANFEVALVTSPDAEIGKLLQREGLPVFTVSMSRGINVLRDIVSVFKMILLLGRIKPMLVHSYTPKAGLVAMFAGWFCRIPIRIHTFTGLIFPSANGLRQKMLIWVDRLICACATHVVPEGVGVKRDLNAYNITHKPLDVIGHGNIAGVDTRHFSPDAFGVSVAAQALRKKLGIVADDAFVLCFVGRLNRDKGLKELMGAFVGMPDNTHLLLVGSLDATAPVDDETLVQIQTHPHVHVLGFVDDIRPVLLASEVMVLPSYREGFPNVVLQAGAMGLSVIATDINGCNEVIEPGYNGWLVPIRDTMALLQAMQHAMRLPKSVRQSMGERARRRIHERFERQDHWNRLVEYYKNLIKSYEQKKTR